MSFIGKKENKELLKSLSIYVIFAIFIGVIMYLPILTNDLVNNIDGLWHQSNFIAGNWEISLGRWLLRYADRARFGVVSSTWNSVLAFLLIGLSDFLIIKAFSFEKTVFSYIFVFATIVNPVICETLTYSFTSAGYGLSYAFAVLAFFALYLFDKKKKKVLLIIPVILISLSLSLYQAYICAFVVLCLFMCLSYLADNQRKQAIHFLLRAIITFIMGGLLYFLLMKQFLLHAGTSLSEYRGAGDISFITILKSLPETFIATYAYYYRYWSNICSQFEFSSIAKLSFCLSILLAFVAAIIKIAKKNIADSVLFFFTFLLIPCGACIISMIAIGNSISGLMSFGIIISAFLVFTFIKDLNKTIRIIYIAASFILLWYLSNSAVNDQIALKEGTRGTTAIVSSVIEDIYDSDLYAKADSVAFIGRAADNPTFYKSTAYLKADGFAQFGMWSTAPENNRMTWAGIINNNCGKRITICDDDVYSAIIAKDVTKNMPLYPNDGYIQIDGATLVVKISNIK